MNPLHLIGGAVLAAVLGFGGGWTVNGWRLDSSHQKAIAEMQTVIDARDESIREQNRAVEASRAATASADERRKVAEKYAVGVMKRIDTQAASVTNSQQADCKGVLQEAWEQWK